MLEKERLSQVFLKDSNLARKLVFGSSITKNDIVIEIGPGRGILTDQLADKAARVIAIEKDPVLARALQEKYVNKPNVQIIQGDILNYRLPDFPYKVFSNIPFAIEGELVRIFLNTRSPLQDGFLFMRREYAMRFAGTPRESQFHITYSPWFDLGIYYSLRRDDFQPKPLVETDILRFRAKEIPLISRDLKHLYEMFIRQGYGNGPMVKQSLTPLPLSQEQLIRLSRELGFKITDKPSDLNLEHWVGMFLFFLTTSEFQQQKFISKARK